MRLQNCVTNKLFWHNIYSMDLFIGIMEEPKNQKCLVFGKGSLALLPTATKARIVRGGGVLVA